MKENGYKIIPIYPKEEEILGERVYRSLDEVDQRVDMINMFRKSFFAKRFYEQIKHRNEM